MKDQYYDSQKNAYRNMDPQLQPGFKAQQKMAANDSISKLLVAAESQKSFELRVWRVPKEMTEDGVRNCFGKYGKIVDLFVKDDKNSVISRKYSEIHGCLKISFWY